MSGIRLSGIALVAIALALVLVLGCWLYTVSQLERARSRGVYDSAEQGMRALIADGYEGISRVDILYAGPNAFDGSQPHVWYVVAEVRAAARADGSGMGRQGCDAPGSYFLQTKDGWLHVSEGAFPEVVGFWMRVFGLAGPGQAQPTHDWAPTQPARFCN